MTDVLQRMAAKVFSRHDGVPSFDHESGECVDATILDAVECRLSASLGMSAPANPQEDPRSSVRSIGSGRRAVHAV